ncbi:MAG: ester cyclase [Actinomycetes bacterium]
MFDRLNEHDTESLRGFWTPATVEYFPDGTYRGFDEVAASFAEKFAAIEGFHLEVLAIAESGDDALVHWRMTGRHVGTLLGVAGTGRAIELDGIDHFVLQDRTVVTNTVVLDQMAFARQVGLLPPDRSPADRALKAAFNARNTPSCSSPATEAALADSASIDRHVEHLKLDAVDQGPRCPARHRFADTSDRGRIGASTRLAPIRADIPNRGRHPPQLLKCITCIDLGTANVRIWLRSARVDDMGLSSRV